MKHTFATLFFMLLVAQTTMISTAENNQHTPTTIQFGWGSREHRRPIRVAVVAKPLIDAQSDAQPANTNQQQADLQARLDASQKEYLALQQRYDRLSQNNDALTLELAALHQTLTTQQMPISDNQ